MVQDREQISLITHILYAFLNELTTVSELKKKRKEKCSCVEIAQLFRIFFFLPFRIIRRQNCGGLACRAEPIRGHAMLSIFQSSLRFARQVHKGANNSKQIAHVVKYSSSRNFRHFFFCCRLCAQNHHHSTTTTTTTTTTCVLLLLPLPLFSMFRVALNFTTFVAKALSLDC